jgi:rhodanese-related sulfurtransferase
MKCFLPFTLFAFATLLTACAGSNSSPSETDTRPQVQEISILKLDSLQAALPNAILLDVRSDEEWAAGHLEGASYISFDWDNRLEPLKALPEDRPVLVYCEAGGRSGVITEELRILGHPYIIDLIGGMEAWSENERLVAFGEPVALP